MARFKVFVMVTALSLTLSPIYTGAQQRKDKNGTRIPDLQVLTVQYPDRGALDEPADTWQGTIVVSVRNNTRDRTVTGILWKIDIKDAKTGKVVETLRPYTFSGAFNPDDKMSIPPHR